MSTENNNAWLNSMTEERDTKLLRALLDEPHLLVIVVSEDGLMEVFNRGCERLTGFSTDDMIGQPLEAVLRMTSDEEQSAPILCHAGRTQLVNWRHRWLGPDTDGRRRRLIVGRFPEGVGQSTPVDWLFGDGHIARVTIENAIDGIIAIDSNGTICSVNPAAERLFGYRAEEMQGRNIGMLMPEPHRSQHDHYIRRYLETGVRRIIGMRRELTAHHRDGTPIELELSVAEGIAGGQQYFIGFTHDITARNRAERESRLHLSHLAHATRIHAMDELASTLAHEIRQPLTAVHTTAQAALIQIDGGKRVPEEIEGHLAQITQQARRASQIIDQLRRFLRRDDPQDLSDHHPSVLVEGVLLLLTHRMQSLGAEAHRSYNAAECRVQVNRTQIEQVIYNLMDNALDAMESVDGPRVLAVATCLSGRNGYCEISIQDTGPGIPDEHMGDLFTPYFTTKDRGMGLGLPLCRSIVENHGGQLTAENRPSGGAAFRVSLPILPGVRHR